MMSKGPIDSKSAGQRNERLILTLLRRQGSLSQAQLCRLVGIGSSTASTIVARLRDKGLVLEKRGTSKRRGPKPIILTLNPHCCYVIGIEINPSFVMIGLFDFLGQMTGKIQAPLGPDPQPDHVIEVICGHLQTVLNDHYIAPDTILGAGVALSGSVSSEGKAHLSSPMGWHDVPLQRRLADTFQFPVSVYSNHVRLLAEIAADPALEAQSVLYLNAANGVGATVFRDGRLVYGATGRHGAIGHNVIDPDGPLCGCGHRGCLEAHISGPALASTITHDIRRGAQTMLSAGLDGQTTPEKLLAAWPRAVAANDAYAITLRDKVAHLIAQSAADAINAFDPDVVILAGYVNLLFAEEFAEAIGRHIAKAVYDFDARRIEIRPAAAGDDALINGICLAVLQDALEADW